MPDLRDRSGLRAWAYQERMKGRTSVNILGGTDGGWGFADKDAAPDYWGTRTVKGGGLEPWRHSPELMNAKDGNGDSVITDQQLREMPFFDHGPPEIADMYDGATGSGSLGSDTAEEHHAMILSRMIPAASNAAGHEAVGVDSQVSIENFDLNDPSGAGGPVLRNEFPEERWNGEEYPWEHSDVREVGYLYLHPFFKFIVETGGL